MPSGGPSILSYMCQILLEKKPRSVLDIGVGHGKWGFLVREYVDLWRPGNKFGEIDQINYSYNTDRFNPERFYGKDRTKLVGIEIFRSYISDIQNMIYDEILIGDAWEWLPTLEDYFDMIICADMLEHLEKDKAIELLKEMKKHAKVSYVLIPVNCGCSDEGEHGNKYEIHRSQWDFNELREFGTCFIVGDVYYILEIKGENNAKL